MIKHNKQEQLQKEHRPQSVKQRLETLPKSQNISDAILGGMDGCVTTFAIVSGAFGAGFSSSVALVLGSANLIADGFSMAVSNYESIKAAQEFKSGLIAVEEDHINHIPEGEKEEIRQIFQKKGFAPEVVEKIVETMSQDKDLWIDTMLTEEYGIQKSEPNPWKSAFVTFISFVLVGLMPLVAFFIPGLVMKEQFIVSAILAGVMFFTIGTLKSFFLAKPMFVSGLSTLLTGGSAAGLAYLTGYILREVLGVM